MRVTKTYSYDRAEDRHFKRVAKEAKSRRPKVSESAMMVEIIKEHFERQDMIKEINKDHPRFGEATTGGPR